MDRTYEELLASQTELVHFNPNHDPRNGRFTKSKVASTAVRAAAIGTAVGLGFAAERAAYSKLKNSDIKVPAIAKSSLYSFGRASVAAALAVIGEHAYQDYKHSKEERNNRKTEKRIDKIQKQRFLSDNLISAEKFEKTPESKALMNKYVDALKTYGKKDSKTKKAETEWRKASNRFIVEEQIKKYGADTVANMNNITDYNGENDLIEKYIDKKVKG